MEGGFLAQNGSLIGSGNRLLLVSLWRQSDNAL
jgi:hypothetical protein